MPDTAWEKCMEHTYGKKLFVVYLKFTFSWVSFIYLFIYFARAGVYFERHLCGKMGLIYLIYFQ